MNDERSGNGYHVTRLLKPPFVTDLFLAAHAAARYNETEKNRMESGGPAVRKNDKLRISFYWTYQCVLGVFLFCLTPISMLFCFFGNSSGRLKAAAMLLLFAVFFLGTALYSVRMAGFCVRNETQVVSYSFFGKKQAAADLKKDVYCEVLAAAEVVSWHDAKEYIVFSNEPFPSYQSAGITRLSALCAAAKKNGKQIVAPYRGRKNALCFPEIADWRKVN